MAKDWRISVCTRYRPLAVLALVIVVWGVSILALFIIGPVIQHKQIESWEAKLASVKAGTARSKLIEILGEPQGMKRFKSSEIKWMPGTSPEELERVKTDHPELVGYYYYKTFFGMTSPEGWSVCLDENEERTVFKPRPLLEIWDGMSYLPAIILLSLGVLALLVWLCFRSWCARQKRKPGLESPPDNKRAL